VAVRVLRDSDDDEVSDPWSASSEMVSLGSRSREEEEEEEEVLSGRGKGSVMGVWMVRLEMGAVLPGNADDGVPQESDRV